MVKWPALIAAIVIVPSLAWSGDDRMVVKKSAHSVAATLDRVSEVLDAALATGDRSIDLEASATGSPAPAYPPSRCRYQSPWRAGAPSHAAPYPVPARAARHVCSRSSRSAHEPMPAVPCRAGTPR